MLEFFSNYKKQKKEKYLVPKSVQQTIPIHAVWEDGIFLVAERMYSKTFKCTDVNYALMPKVDKNNFLLTYGDLINALDHTAATKITINQRRINEVDFRNSLFIPNKEDGLDEYRHEYNSVIEQQGLSSNGMIREIYITVTSHKKDIQEAREYFTRLAVDLGVRLSRLGSTLLKMDAKERLHILHDFYQTGRESEYRFNFKDMQSRGHSIKDYISPDDMQFPRNSTYFKLGDRYARAMFFREFPSYLKDDLIKRMTSLKCNVMISIDITPVQKEAAVKKVENKLMGVEKNITDWQMRQNARKNFAAEPPHQYRRQQEELKEFLDDMQQRDQKMLLCTITLVHSADSLKELESDTREIIGIADEYSLQIGKLKYRQLDGFNTALPIGVRKITNKRTLTTESLSAFMPFRAQEIMDPGGVFMGINAISNSLIICNRENLSNYSAFLFGAPGYGKSFSAKELMTFVRLATDDDIIVCDPEGEYSKLFAARPKGLGGQIIKIAPGSGHFINIMDMVDGYGESENNPVADKSQFLATFIKQIESRELSGQEISIVDRCTELVYQDYKNGGPLPTLCVLRDKMLSQPEQEAKHLALGLEAYTEGSRDLFAHATNVDVHNRVLVYDISALSKAMMKVGLLAVTDAMLNRVNENYKKGRRTWVFIDEFHVMYQDPYAADFLTSAWRQFRKRDAFPTGITQNIEYMLSSVQGSTMISNSDMIIMLSQKGNDLQLLSEKLDISDEQLHYIIDQPKGCGLIKYGGALVPFINQFPEETKLFELMNTDPTKKGKPNEPEAKAS